MSTVRDDDPLTRVMAPPPDESEEDRKARLHAEAEAKRISDAIDEELREQARAERRGPKPTKMLLLGELRRMTPMTLSVLIPTECDISQVRVNQVRSVSFNSRYLAPYSSGAPIRQIHHAQE